MESSNLATALAADGAAIDASGKYDYIDNQTIDAVGVEIAQSANSEDFEPAKEKAAAPQMPPAEAKVAEPPATDDTLEGLAF